MKLRARLMALSVSTVAVIVGVLLILQLDSLTKAALDTALDRSNLTGHTIELLIVRRITDIGADGEGNLAQTRRNWNRVVARDKDIAAALVESAAVRSGVIVEINIIGEDGRVLVSSVPSHQGLPAPVMRSLSAMSRSGALARLIAITSSTEDYETRVPLAIEQQTKPVFEIQLLVSPVLLRDKVKPDLWSAAKFSVFALLAAVGLAAFSANLALRPVRRIGRAIDTLSTGRPLGLNSSPQNEKQDREVEAIEYKLGLLGEKMQGARRDADQMRTAFGSLARGVAHEIRNPLNAMGLRLETLRMKIVDELPEAEGEIDLVSNEIQRLDRVVRTFLDLNKPMELEIRTFDPGEVAGTVLEILRPAATQAKVELQSVARASPGSVQADRGLIEQCLLNVVKNAIQAMENSNGGVVKTSVEIAAGTCRIAVADNGPGMPSDVKDHIFDPYFTTRSTGTGIGLALTKRAIDLHRGTIQVTSSPGEGTTFTLAFPAVRSQS